MKITSVMIYKIYRNVHSKFEGYILSAIGYHILYVLVLEAGEKLKFWYQSISDTMLPT